MSSRANISPGVGSDVFGYVRPTGGLTAKKSTVTLRAGASVELPSVVCHGNQSGTRCRCARSLVLTQEVAEKPYCCSLNLGAGNGGRGAIRCLQETKLRKRI